MLAGAARRVARATATAWLAGASRYAARRAAGETPSGTAAAKQPKRAAGRAAAASVTTSAPRTPAASAAHTSAVVGSAPEPGERADACVDAGASAAPADAREALLLLDVTAMAQAKVEGRAPDDADTMRAVIAHVHSVLEACHPVQHVAAVIDTNALRALSREHPALEFAPAVIRALSVPLVEVTTADRRGVIARYAQLARAADMRVVIASPDRAFLQCIDDSVSVLETSRTRLVGISDAQSRFAVAPGALPLYWALTGDGEDVAGVKGVGAKSAETLLGGCMVPDELRARLGEGGPARVRKLVQEAWSSVEEAYASLVIRATPGVPVPIARLKLTPPNLENASRVLVQYNCEDLARLLLRRDKETKFHAALLRGTYSVVSSPSQLAAVVRDVKKRGVVAVEVIVSHTNPFDSRPVGVALSWKEGEAVYVPFAHEEQADATTQVSTEAGHELLRMLAGDAGVRMVAHDLKAVVKAFSSAGIALEKGDDTMVMSYNLYCGKFDQDHETCVQQHLGAELTPAKAVVGTMSTLIPFARAPIALVSEYAGQRADATLRMYRMLEPRLASEGLRKLYDDIDRPVLFALAAMELEGVMIDREHLNTVGGDLRDRMNELQLQIFAEAGCEFNVNSTQQLGEILSVQLESAGGARGKTGHFSTNHGVLEKLAQDGHKLPQLVLQHRAAAKLQRTYVEGLLEVCHPVTSRVHTIFMNALTNTGRLSSVSPNLQNIPIRSADGRMIRHAFVAKPGHVLIKADYSQVELRILAHVANVGALLNAFSSNVDVHRLTASQVFGVPVDKVDGSMRQRAKAINFGIVYGISEFGLSRQINSTVEQARRYIDMYFEQYPGIQRYMIDTKQQCRQSGFVSTVFGRRCWLPDITHAVMAKRSFAERAAINTPIQGSSADITRIAMHKLHKHLRRELPDTRMLLQVHDELVFESPEGDASREAAAVIKSTMEGISAEHGFRVPLPVDITIGKRWLDASG